MLSGLGPGLDWNSLIFRRTGNSRRTAGLAPPDWPGLAFDYAGFVFTKNMKMVDEDGWVLEFRAENDTK